MIIMVVFLCGLLGYIYNAEDVVCVTESVGFENMIKNSYSGGFNGKYIFDLRMGT